ncbi:bsr1784 [Bradyrhizobium diazoefficiens USDA 110]|nr:ID158 [Bradyrhizobium japonicum]AND87391.1 hypothetical protein AAV28_05845 [Bradyrhizobium diazoefficiens USDA 110]BAC47049.1 bsr1784 [Bradyrhizobium diazoefficiens USDA 110]
MCSDNVNNPSRTALRQVDKCCGDRPWRRATSETTAPGTKDSATIRPLTSPPQRRRTRSSDASTTRSIIYANRPLQDGTHIAGLLNSNKVRETRRLP